MTSIKLLLIATLMASVTAQAKMYRWVDDDGKVHFSDKVPPKTSKHGHSALNKQGLETDRVASEKERHEALEKKQKAITDAVAEQERQRLEALREAEDKKLLATYESRDEILSAYKRKLANLNQSQSIMQARDESLSQKLRKLRQQKKNTKDQQSLRYILLEIRDTRKSLVDYRKAMHLNKQDRQEIASVYREKLLRFDELSKKDKE